MNLENRVVFVTGGSRGIGAAIVSGAAAAGARVVLHYGQRRDAAESLADVVGRDRCRLVAADLMIPGIATKLWNEAEHCFGGIDVLVNNAGLYEAAAVDGDDQQWALAWSRALQVNLVAAADLCRQAIRHFRVRGGGIVINVASRAAFRGEAPDYANYAASKAGMIGLTRTIARGFARDGVLAYAVAPGFVATDMAEDYLRIGDNRARITGEIPLGEIPPPTEVANVVVFLASGMARHATGTTIDVNGASYVR